MYRGDNNVIQGVTKSCYEAFGISSRLTLGENIDFSEFTIDKIFPEILIQNKQELKGGGLIMKIDTTSLAQEFLIGRDSSGLNIEEEDEY